MITEVESVLCAIIGILGIITFALMAFADLEDIVEDDPEDLRRP